MYEIYLAELGFGLLRIWHGNSIISQIKGCFNVLYRSYSAKYGEYRISK